MPQVEVEACVVDYRRWGAKGRPVVFLHGGFGSSASLWRKAASALPAGWAAYGPNLFMRSGRPAGGWNIPGFARHVAGFIDALGLAPAVLVGHSMGGVVAQCVAVEHGDRLAGLVLVCTGPNVRNHGIAEQVMAELAANGNTRDTMEAISRHWFHGRADPVDFEAYMTDAMQAPLQAMLDAQRSLLETNMEPRLGRIAVPTLIVHGAKDHGRPMAHAETLAAGIRDSRLVTIADSGHAPMLETPDAFADAMAGFLGGLPAPALARETAP
jgi:pimeloyl-ACP methyl ester carboxylesterase